MRERCFPYGERMKPEQFAKAIAASLARHQTRGLVDGAAGMSDVVIHGRVSLRGVAEDLIAAQLHQSRPVNRSWAAWFACAVADRREIRRLKRKRERLIEQRECGSTEAEIALARLKLRDGEIDHSGIE